MAVNRKVWVPVHPFAWAATSDLERIDGLFTLDLSQPQFPRIPTLLHKASNLETLCIPEAFNVIPYLIEMLGHYELPESLHTLHISHAATNPHWPLLRDTSAIAECSPSPAGQIHTLELDLEYTRNSNHLMFGTVLEQIPDAVIWFDECWKLSLIHI